MEEADLLLKNEDLSFSPSKHKNNTKNKVVSWHSLFVSIDQDNGTQEAKDK